MFISDLNKRRNKILQVIVESYIETAQPVSSQSISQRLRSRISSATIRNAMHQLDELGLIWQPHTSAGRIPTDKGYRYYIDTLLEVGVLTHNERELMQSRYPSQNEAYEELLKEVLNLLSALSGYTTMAFSTGLKSILFKKLELISVYSSKILVVLVSPEGSLKTAVVQLPYQVTQTELVKIARFLNEEFEGLRLDEIKAKLSARVLFTQDAFFHLLKKATEILNAASEYFNKDILFIEGTSHIFEQPEFRDAQKVYGIFKVIEEKAPLLSILKEGLENEGVNVYIGRENDCVDIQECSLVVSSFKVQDSKLGAIGILGPRRMSYAKVISAVDYMSQMLSQRITHYWM